MKIEKLYYFHAWFNKRCFGGDLEPAIIKTFSGDETFPDDPYSIEAQTTTYSDPIIIYFNSDLFFTDIGSDPDEVKNEELCFLTVLLHEMCHQYNAECGVCDVDFDGTHLDAFLEVSEGCGMVKSGYALGQELEKLVLEEMEKYDLHTSY